MDALAQHDLRKTPLHALHVELGGKMVAFAGYDMPVNYPAGILKEHLHTRAAAGLFDVSHMGQRTLIGPDHATTARALEAITPGDFQSLAIGRMRYSLLLKDDGGIIDDLMVTRWPEDGKLGLVVERLAQGNRRRFYPRASSRQCKTRRCRRPCAARIARPRRKRGDGAALPQSRIAFLHERHSR